MRNSPNMKRYLRKCALNVRNVSFLSTFRTFKGKRLRVYTLHNSKKAVTVD